TVVAVGRSASKLEMTRPYGADHVLATEGGARVRDQLKAMTGGRGADVVYDAVGGTQSVEALRAAAFGARFVIVGWASTPAVARGGREANVLPTNLILMKGIDVLGAPAAIAVHREPFLRAQRLAWILGHAQELRPHISAAFPLAQLHDVLHAKWQGKHPGNVVVHP
ncbi:MAG: zinc-binding dehydrogenase, partial [Deltaproteobacteria bacterium]|nr:zinc-binding dehydrogenase [Nannocystaceae bacterium]